MKFSTLQLILIGAVLSFIDTLERYFASDVKITVLVVLIWFLFEIFAMLTDAFVKSKVYNAIYRKNKYKGAFNCFLSITDIGLVLFVVTNLIVICFNITVGKVFSCAMLAFYMLLDIAALLYLQYRHDKVRCRQTYYLLAILLVYRGLYSYRYLVKTAVN